MPSANTSTGPSAQKKAAVQKPQSESGQSDSDESDNRHKTKTFAANRRSVGKVLMLTVLVTSAFVQVVI